MPPVPTDSAHVDATARVLDTLDHLLRVAAWPGAVWLAVQGVAKPFMEWRRKSIGRTIRDALEPDLKKLSALVDREEDCAEAHERVLERQAVMFGEFDNILSILTDNRSRIDEVNELLDQVFALDRRVDGERRREVDAMLAQLNHRRQAERRKDDEARAAAEDKR